MKASEVLQRALERIESGLDRFCCFAIDNASPRWIAGIDTAREYFSEYRPEGRLRGMQWWPADDKESRIAALHSAINDALAEGN